MYIMIFTTVTASSRTLISIPTRRSSDLRFRGLWGSHHDPGPIPPPLVCNPDACPASILAWLAGQASGLQTRDRKSTRLNSSHQIISYAVLCLKKKITTSHSHTTHLCTSH